MHSLKPICSLISPSSDRGLKQQALRTALENGTMIEDVKGEHPLGAVLVATVFEGFYSAGLFIAKSYYHKVMGPQSGAKRDVERSLNL